MVPSKRATDNAASLAPPPKTARILAIDYGRRRIGLAICDELRVTARPLATLERTNRKSDLRHLRELVRENGVGIILVGHPVHLSGQSSEMSEEAAQFAKRLREELGMPVELRDERLTSWEAKQTARDLKSNKNANIDSLAAAILLREYLNEQPINSRKPKIPVRK
jgi:putative holliday junction resolvase